MSKVIRMVAANRTEATVWLTTGEMLVFRCAATKLAITRNIIEVRRERVGTPHRTFIPIEARTLADIKGAVAAEIRKYRAQFLLPVPPVEERFSRAPFQLSLTLVR